jgi:hypothetical protein
MLDGFTQAIHSDMVTFVGFDFAQTLTTQSPKYRDFSLLKNGIVPKCKR